MKKLLLTSDGFTNPNIGHRFLELAHKKPDSLRVLFVPTAALGEAEMSYVYESEEELTEFGILKKNIIWAEDLNNLDIDNYDVIYVCGGNTFYLLNEIRQTKFDQKIIDFINQGGLYVGVSAGSIIVCPDISIAAPFDPNDIGLQDTTGLKIIDKVITPHYQNKEKQIIDEWKRGHAYKIIRLNDGQAFEVSDRQEKVIQ